VLEMHRVRSHYACRNLRESWVTMYGRYNEQW